MVSGYDLQFTHAMVGMRGRSILKTGGVSEAKIFNLLPEQLVCMNTDHIDLFKNHFDVFPSSIPDQPTMAWLGRYSKFNSLLHQLPLSTVR